MGGGGGVGGSQIFSGSVYPASLALAYFQSKISDSFPTNFIPESSTFPPCKSKVAKNYNLL